MNTRRAMLLRLAMAWLAITVSTVLAPLPCHAQEQPRSAPMVPTNPQAFALLRLFVRHFGKAPLNHIYVAPVLNDDGDEYLYAYWKEGDSILLFEHFLRPVPDDPKSELFWLERKARIDLKTEVVETQDEIPLGSTYLVDRPWADRIIDACRTRGTEVVIRRRQQPEDRAVSPGAARPN